MENVRGAASVETAPQRYPLPGEAFDFAVARAQERPHSEAIERLRFRRIRDVRRMTGTDG
jgi:hypothetical protein